MPRASRPNYLLRVSRRRRGRRLLGILVLLVLAAAGWVYWQRQEPPNGSHYVSAPVATDANVRRMIRLDGTNSNSSSLPEVRILRRSDISNITARTESQLRY